VERQWCTNNDRLRQPQSNQVFNRRRWQNNDDAGRRTQQIANDSSRTSWTYDAASNLTKVQDKKADNSTISSFDYRTDNVGNRTGATLASGVRVTWVYDNSNQLIAERRSGISGYANTFVYDTVGNRLVLNANGTRTTTVYDNANQIKYSTAAAGRTTYTFDANGNQQIVREPAGARTTTTWNYEMSLGASKPATHGRFKTSRGVNVQ